MLADHRHQEHRKAILVLKDGSYYFGRGFGATKKTSGEVVFSTGMVGYTEALADPSYQGQILTLTYPLVGNYGIPQRDSESDVLRYFESESIKVKGLVIHELCDRPHHWASVRTLHQWLRDESIPGIFDVDTRRITKKLRVEGVMLGILKVCSRGRGTRPRETFGRSWGDPRPEPEEPGWGSKHQAAPLEYESGGNRTVALIDCGVKHGILRSLLNRKINVVRVPYDFSVAEILEYKPDGVVVSNGPGNPKNCEETVDCVGGLVEEGVLIMGICLGTQMLALALSGDTYKLKYGHRSQNQPALDLQSGRCYITTRNHGYAVDPNSLEGTNLKVWFINANDKTVEGVVHVNKPAFGVQWRPEASPGPYDTEFLFEGFLKRM